MYCIEDINVYFPYGFLEHPVDRLQTSHSKSKNKWNEMLEKEKEGRRRIVKFQKRNVGERDEWKGTKRKRWKASCRRTGYWMSKW